MHDHAKIRAFELADEVATLVYRVAAELPKEELVSTKGLKTERVLNGLIRALRLGLWASAFSLKT